MKSGTAVQPHLLLDTSQRIGLAVPFEGKLIEVLRSIRGYRWDKERKIWTFPLERGNLDRLLDVLHSKQAIVDPRLDFALNSVAPVSRGELVRCEEMFPEKVLFDLRKELRLRDYSRKTLKAYTSCVRSFLSYFAPRHPLELTPEACE
jgi:hypothetical protein